MSAMDVHGDPVCLEGADWWLRLYAESAGRAPWNWAALPGLRGRALSTRFSIGDFWEEFSLHDNLDGSIVVREWCATKRLTPSLCRDPAMLARARAWLTSERRPEAPR